MKKLITLLLLTLPLTLWAQDAVYLLGTDGTMEANHASATLEKSSGDYATTGTPSVYTGKVTFTAREFTVTTRLSTTADDWDGIRDARFAPSSWEVYTDQEMNIYDYDRMEMNFFMSCDDKYLGKPLDVTITLTGKKKGKILIAIPEDAEEAEEAEEGDTYTPIDLTQGAHFTVTVNEPGSLKQRLTNAVFQTDYDLVDYLTIKGKLGGADIAYLQAQEGLVSQLQYLDLTDVELVYDDEPYFQNGTSSFYSQHINIFTLSAENKDENGPYGGMQGQVSITSTYCRRNDLSHAFEKMQYLKECYLPKTLPAVGERMFDETSLSKVGMPTAPTYIGDGAFINSGAWYGAQGTLTAIDIPASVERIGASAFASQPITTIDVRHVTSFGGGCFSGTAIQSIQLNDAVEAIPNDMFSGSKLRSISIPAAVVEIGGGAFSGCEKLTSVTMGEGVKKIGAGAFSGCTALNDMTISPNIEEIGQNAFAGIYYYGEVSSDIPWVAALPVEDGVIYICKVAYKHVDGSELSIKEGTVSIADAFINTYKGINSITLPSTLRILGSGCLANAVFSSIELPDALEKIGDGALSNCSKLRRITIPKNVTSIGGEAFSESALVRVYYNAIDAENVNDGWSSSPFPESITRVIIGEGVKALPDNLFNGSKNLTRVQMPSTVERIGDYAFANCGSLESIDLPSSLKHLGRGAFVNDNLSEVSVYMAEPLNFMTLPDDDEFKENWQQGDDDNYGRGYAGPFGGDVIYWYHIDADGNITFEEGIDYRFYDPLPLLRVPNGTLAIYQGDWAWSASFQTIEQFDGASGAEAIEETTTVSVSETVTDDTDLTGTMMGSVYVTLDTEDSGDGYNATEGCLVINSTTTDEGLAAATADDADDLTVKNQFNGLIFEVPAGKGSIVIDCQTLGQQAVYVKIGSGEPQEVATTARQQLTIPYEVSEPTRIYVYGAKSTTANAAPKANAARRAAYANDNAVKLYGLTINVDENLSGIDTPTATSVTADGKWYTLDGRRLTSKPQQKGVYIVNGKKVVIK